MGHALLSEVAEQPATTAVVCVLIGTWFGLHQRQLGYPEVGLSYDRAIVQRQAWRVLTAQLSHIELLHLIFNCSSLWSLGYLERAGWRASQHTSLQYLGTSLLLLVLSGIATLAVYHVLIVYLRKEHFIHVTMVGYSAVVFGLMTLGAFRLGGSFSVVGIVELPSSAAPFVSLVLTSLIIRQASFVGHLAGILSGAAISIGLFDWINGWWAFSLAVWAVALALWQSISSGALQLPSLRGSGESELEAGSAALLAHEVEALDV